MLHRSHSNQPPHITNQGINRTANAGIPSSKEQRIEILLKEYELCTIDANHLEDSIWTATSILIIATGAAIGFLSISSAKNMYELIIHFAVSVFSLFIVRVWYRIVTLWHNVQGEVYYRSEKIEKELNMEKNKKIRDELLSMKRNRKEGYSVTDSLLWIRRILLAIWICFPLLQGFWYVAQITRISNTWWLSIK